MPNGATTIENEWSMELTQNQLAAENAAEEPERVESKTAEGHFINSGEATLLLAFTGIMAGISWLLDFIPYV